MEGLWEVVREGGTYILAEAEGAVAVREAGAPVALAVADVRDAGSGVFGGILRPAQGWGAGTGRGKKAELMKTNQKFRKFTPRFRPQPF